MSSPILLAHNKLLHYPQFFKDVDMQTLLDELTLNQEQIRMFGKAILVPRLTDYQGTKPYTYSGKTHSAKPFTPLVGEMLKAINALTDFGFNSVLFNYYRNGEDYMGFHKDDEKEIDASLIASVSFGASRRFVGKHDVSKEKVEVVLGDGDLLLMKDFQTEWKHALPKMMRVNEPRLNLTFRRIIG